MSFSPVEMENQVFKVMDIVLSKPSERWPIMAEKAGLEKDQLFDILDYLDREGYLANINFSRGKKNKILIPYLDDAAITEKGMMFMKKMQGENEGKRAPDNGSGAPWFLISRNRWRGFRE